ncbi:universal stress protein [Nocardia carnea]|uniref:universal stress protein n=1 Tax=Nocardia carnea TaxID=37328 RepID=UPI0024585A6D|nr:universal stress protein [Nocardia carnea]
MTTGNTGTTRDLASAAVVVGTDGSKASVEAVRWAAQTASRRGRRLHIVHCLDIMATRAAFGTFDLMEPAVTENMHKRGTALLESAAHTARTLDPTLTVTTELTEGPPAETLIALSRTAYLVALGATPGVGTFAHLGSVLLAVVAHGHGSIVVVRGSGHAQPDNRPVVVGVDGSRVGEAAIAAAFAEASDRDAELIAVHAWSDLSEGQFAGISYLAVPMAEMETGEHALLIERLAGWQEKYPDVKVTRQVFLNGPRKHLSDWSKTAQLVVVGNRGRGGFKGLLLGSTSNWLVQHADCPVMVVHPE